jgi:hypothetical protein
VRTDELVDDVSMLGKCGGRGSRRGEMHANWMSRARDSKAHSKLSGNGLF